jgi:adenylyltransferase/sulfurtransferase
MQHLQPEELLIWKNENKPHLLVDIREEYEVAICTLDGLHIPMEHVIEKYPSLPKENPIVFHCNSGKRSDALVYMIEKKFPGDAIYSLAGGVQGYAEQCAPEIKCSL